MENHDKNKIEQIVKTRKQAHGYYLKKLQSISIFCGDGTKDISFIKGYTDAFY
jgi:hypothetical protein